MGTGMIIGLAIGIPIILLPAALVWYLNISGIYTVIVETRKRQVAREKRSRLAQIKQ